MDQVEAGFHFKHELPCCPGHVRVERIWKKAVEGEGACFLTTLIEVTHITSAHIAFVRASHLAPPGYKGEDGTYSLGLGSGSR